MKTSEISEIKEMWQWLAWLKAVKTIIKIRDRKPAAGIIDITERHNERRNVAQCGVAYRSVINGSGW